MAFSRRTAALKGSLDAVPGAVCEPLSARHGSAPHALIYKVAGKMFAILSVRDSGNLIVKCEPELAAVLRRQYAGIGHRSHLDARFWISIDLAADVPLKHIKRLAAQSYELVSSKLTQKQRANLGAPSKPSRKPVSV